MILNGLVYAIFRRLLLMGEHSRRRCTVFNPGDFILPDGIHIFETADDSFQYDYLRFGSRSREMCAAIVETTPQITSLFSQLVSSRLKIPFAEVVLLSKCFKNTLCIQGDQR